LSTDTSFVTRSKEENWLPILELAVEEVFAIMLGCRVKPVAGTGHSPNGEVTAMVSMAGSLCGTLTVRCDQETAGQIAGKMLTGVCDAEGEIADALGELSNMIAGNFKNKLSGLDERCLLSIPTVVSGGGYRFRSLASGSVLETVILLEGSPVAVRLQLQQ
jgi:chemotaxis protein CheX